MERRFIACLLIYFWSLGFSWAQPPDTATTDSTLLGSDFYSFARVLGAHENSELVLSKMNQLHCLLNLHQQKFEGEKYTPKAARYLFKKVHKTFLKRYLAYRSDTHFFARGEYDCVSGSAMMALAFQQAGYQVEIHETPFHVYLILHLTSSQRIMLESTNAFSGFITDSDLISELQKQYTFDNKQEKHPSHPSFNRIISLRELLGLQIYNQGIACFNKQQFAKAKDLFQYALSFYQEDRIKAIHQLSSDLMTNPTHQVVEQLKQQQNNAAKSKGNE